jgi:hypothetical protein
MIRRRGTLNAPDSQEISHHHTPDAADMVAALISPGGVRIALAVGTEQVETRLLRWRPEYRGRA